MLDLLGTSRHLLLTPSVDDHSLLCIQTDGGTYGIDSRVATTDHGDTLAPELGELRCQLLRAHHIVLG